MPILMDCDPILKSVQSFAVDLYSQVLTKEGEVKLKNQFLSPLSIFASLSTLLAGSASETRDELLRVMHLTSSEGDKSLHEAISGALTELLTSLDGVTLPLGNGLFVDHTARLKESYKSIVTGLYKAGAENVDFKGDMEGVRKHINKWVNDQVEGKVPELLPPSSLPSDTRVLSVNTMYFKTKWVHPFYNSSMVEDDFFLLNGQSKKVQMLDAVVYAGSLDLPNLDAKLLKMFLEYYGRPWRMVIVFPNKRDGLIALSKQLSNPDQWSDVFEKNEYWESFHVWLPRFKLCSDGIWDTTQTLRDLGLSTLFDPKKADLSGVSEKELFVSQVKHEAILELAEEDVPPPAECCPAGGCPGCAAYAATTVPKIFRVDHPFLVLVVEENGIPMFMGQVVEPEGC